MGSRLIYDGDCGFCRYTVDYARQVAPDVEYRTYQSVGQEYPHIGEAEFAASIQLFVNGERHQGARAAFQTLALGGRGGWMRLYRVPGLSAVFEILYRWVSSHRETSYRVSRLFFGSSLGPRRHSQTADLLYRGIAGCGLAAFLSFWWQAHALIGADGILPVSRFFEAVAGQYGIEGFFLLPGLFWLSSGDPAIHLVCATGVLCCLIGLAGRLRFTAALCAYICYLSLVHGGQVFMSFQWDILLAECFVLAAILSRGPTLGIWVARLLLFRFMLLSGAVKLLSGDVAWAQGEALAYHFETQPLPTALAWYAHQLPEDLLKAGVLATFVIELVLPFFIFLPRNPRLLAGAGIVLLEVLILATGSYNFFNLLTLVLCVSLFDDGDRRWLRGIVAPDRRRWGAVLAATLIIVQGFVITGSALLQTPTIQNNRFLRTTAPFLYVNPYGLFAVMTTERNELVVEGSMDGERWLAYGFPYKPGALDRRPALATPHQPRLDWQMWFAALGEPQHAPWINDFVFALLRGSPGVLALLEDPFDGSSPPQFVRILRYRYRFASSEARAEDDWWSRSEPEIWLDRTYLREPVITHEPLTVD